MSDLLDPQRVVAQLRILRRQRSLHAVDVTSPDLSLIAELLHLDAVEPAAAHTVLFEGLTRAAEVLPEPDSTVVLIVYGINDRTPLLKDRLAHAGKAVGRDARTVRRWLDRAEALMARGLIDRYGGAEDPSMAPHGWYNTEFATKLDLSRQPLFVTRRTIRVTAPRLRVLVESVSVPRVAAPEPEFVGLEGACVIEVRRTSATAFQVSYELDREARAGEEYEFVSCVRMASPAQMSSMSAMMPIRPCRRYTSEVVFGNPPQATRVWRLGGIPPIAIEDPPIRGAMPVTPGLHVTTEFTHLRPGLVYGVAWEWAEAIHDET